MCTGACDVYRFNVRRQQRLEALGRTRAELLGDFLVNGGAGIIHRGQVRIVRGNESFRDSAAPRDAARADHPPFDSCAFILNMPG